MPNTSRGYPYPANTDAPAGPAQMQALANAINTDVIAVAGDTGWTNLVAGGSGGFAKWRKIGPLVEVVAAISGASIVSGATATTIVTAANGLPSSARPVDTIYGISNLGGQKAGTAVLSPDGSLAAYNDTGATVTVFRCSFTFFVG